MVKSLSPLRTSALLALIGAIGLSCGGSGGGGSGNEGGSGGGGALTAPLCVASARPGNGEVMLERAFAKLSFEMPVGLLQNPADDAHWYVLEKQGRVLLFENTPDVSQSSVVLDIRSTVDSGPSEAGLLGMAFDPDFSANGRAILSYTRDGRPLVSYISSFTSTDGGRTLSPSSEQVIITQSQPYANHNGGQVAFGPDGRLYIGFGDGGSAGDPQGNAQNTQTLLGKILRIQPQPEGYVVPGDNPFANGGGRAEVFAYGLRNPWRFSFDQETGTLWAADVGQNAWEEINIIRSGGNYGWNIREGAHCFDAASCSSEGLIDPVAEYDHSQGCSVTGGYVYRGTAIPGLVGHYIYGDYCSGRIWALDTERPDREPALLADSGLSITSFAQGNNGEIYVVDGGGEIFRLLPRTTGATAEFADRLSDTGCTVAGSAEATRGMVPYQLNAPFWSDGAEKGRWLSIPADSRIRVGSDGDFEFPPGSVLRKDFHLRDQLVETRLFVRHMDGRWAGYSYEWDESKTDALRVSDTKTVSIDGQPWTFPSGPQCMECHTAAAGFALGPEISQLNLDVLAPEGGSQNLLQTLGQLNLLEQSLPAPPEALDRLANPQDEALPLELRARAYLHTNCAQCHRPGGVTSTPIDLRYSTPFPQMELCDTPPRLGSLGVSGARLIAPGNAEQSVLLLRMQRRDRAGMPPLASHESDEFGTTLISKWIETLSACH